MVVLGLIGLPAAGKSAVASELCKNHGFECILIGSSDVSQGFRSLSLNSGIPKIGFKTLQEASDFALTNWTKNFVLLGLTLDKETLELFKLKPLFVLMQVLSPTMTRYRRLGRPDPLEQFVASDDHLISDPFFTKIQESCKINLNNDGSLEDLHCALGKLDLANKKWFRPAWDFYFMKLADLASQRSNCMKRRVGAVIAHDSKVVATGYNGTPKHLKNCSEGGCPRCNGNVKCGLGLDTCLCLHGEENALLEVGAIRASGATLYSTSTPCLGCTKKIIQVGIKRVVYDVEYSLDHNSKDLFDEAGVICEKLQPDTLKHYSCKFLASSSL